MTIIEIGDWGHERKSYVLYNICNSPFGKRVLPQVIADIVNNDEDVCVCATCMLKGFDKYAQEYGIDVIDYWYVDYTLKYKL